MSMSDVEIGELENFYQKTPYVLGVLTSKMTEEFGGYFHSIGFISLFALDL